MASKFLQFLNLKLNLDNPPSTESSQRIPIATCVLLLEMANADDQFSRIEQERIREIIADQYTLTTEAAEALLALSERERHKSLDLWQFTNMINNHFSYDEKMQVLETLWRVIYADGKVDMYEEYLIRRLSNLLNMKHKDLIQAKFNARD
jgi:uncharacterized tellurite resistance protein B-like protein